MRECEDCKPQFVMQGVSTFNDDIESTAAAVLAAVLGAVQLKGVPPLSKQVFLMLGAGQANIGSARLLTGALQAEGLTEAEARSRIWLFDSKVLRCRQELPYWPAKRSPGCSFQGLRRWNLTCYHPQNLVGAGSGVRWAAGRHRDA